MKKMKKAGVLVSAIATTAVCASMIAGSTFALFTSEDQVDITVSSGNVSITADVNGSIKTPVSIKKTNDGYEIGEYETSTSAGFNATSDGLINVTNVIPGDKVELTVGVENTGSVKAKYNFTLECVEGVALMNKLVVDVEEDTVDATDGVKKYTSDWAEIDAGAKATYTLTLELPASLDNAYKNLSTKIKTTVFAVQYNADMSNPENNVEKFPVVEGTADLTKGGMLVLNSDLALTDTVTFDKDTEIDLGAHRSKIATAWNVQDGAEVVLENGDIALSRAFTPDNTATDTINTTNKDSKAAIFVRQKSSLTLNKINFETEGSALFPAGDAASLNVINSTIKASGYGIGTNAASDENYNVKINLKDSAITSNNGVAVCTNVPCELVMDNCTAIGATQGVYIRAGSAIIKNSTLKCVNTGAYENLVGANWYGLTSTAKDGELQVTEPAGTWGSGNSGARAALVVGCKGGIKHWVENKEHTRQYYAGYASADVVVDNCTFESATDYVTYAWANGSNYNVVTTNNPLGDKDLGYAFSDTTLTITNCTYDNSVAKNVYGYDSGTKDEVEWTASLTVNVNGTETVYKK